MTFLQWLRDQRGRRDRLGELASLAAGDLSGRKPRLYHSLEDWRAHLADLGASDALALALDDAWHEWCGGASAELPRDYLQSLCKHTDRTMWKRAAGVAAEFAAQTGLLPIRGTYKPAPCARRLLGLRHRGQRFYGDHECDGCPIPRLDHGEAWGIGSDVKAIVFHPYDSPGEELFSWCEGRGLWGDVYDRHYSWYWPGHTYLVVIRTKEDVTGEVVGRRPRSLLVAGE